MDAEVAKRLLAAELEAGAAFYEVCAEGARPPLRFSVHDSCPDRALSLIHISARFRRKPSGRHPEATRRASCRVPPPAPFACYSPQKHAARVAHAPLHSYNQIADSIYYWLASNNGPGRKVLDGGQQSIEAVGGAVNVISRRGCERFTPRLAQGVANRRTAECPDERSG